MSPPKDIVGVSDRKVDSGDYKPEDYRVMQSEGYRHRLGEMRQRLSFGCTVDSFKNIVSGLPAGESFYGRYAAEIISFYALITFLAISHKLSLYVVLSYFSD